jgi:hypothetical protein
MQSVVKGMIQVVGTTDRIVRAAHGQYNVIRFLDDARVGAFSNDTVVKPIANGLDDRLVREIARVAIQGAKTSWVGSLAAG